MLRSTSPNPRINTADASARFAGHRLEKSCLKKIVFQLRQMLSTPNSISRTNFMNLLQKSRLGTRFAMMRSSLEGIPCLRKVRFTPAVQYLIGLHNRPPSHELCMPISSIGNVTRWIRVHPVNCHGCRVSQTSQMSAQRSRSPPAGKGQDRTSSDTVRSG